MNKIEQLIGKLFGIIAEIPPVRRFLANFKPERPMKYPYTFTAKMVQFPFRYLYTNNRFIRYYPHAVVLSMPVFYYFHRLANSPENKQKWAEIRRKEREEVHYH
ncbi:hypothetical protein TcasGA2_TC034306 [Tribolium castaneum]|uniref:Uncharacterized protein n=1 Tax=Tribolium castaneum TaxID=7070 RepID=A0A139WC81_TRICA|nr:PREDICTED: uncharacterized protein LOC103314194 [Tribolium castaneum]KYB25533.1 hypothetical protein TcasGA2_TC034306 [Tribolium castaneum]|eukprot:XP_008197702.1 PREDICTED: uncharacterized protein LOC103314194 [Tribolium castaneum]